MQQIDLQSVYAYKLLFVIFSAKAVDVEVSVGDKNSVCHILLPQRLKRLISTPIVE